jgi:hypothetical protein
MKAIFYADHLLFLMNVAIGKILQPFNKMKHCAHKHNEKCD